MTLPFRFPRFSLCLRVLGVVFGLGLLALTWSSSSADAGAPLSDGDGDGDDHAGEDKKDQQVAKDCVTHTAEARYVYGYNHLVHIQNGCEKAARCKVSTNVNPEVQSVTIAAHSKTTVLTFRGSPSREFEAKVDCELTK